MPARRASERFELADASGRVRLGLSWTRSDVESDETRLRLPDLDDFTAMIGSSFERLADVAGVELEDAPSVEPQASPAGASMVSGWRRLGLEPGHARAAAD